jgi:hypothetical protein
MTHGGGSNGALEAGKTRGIGSSAAFAGRGRRRGSALLLAVAFGVVAAPAEPTPGNPPPAVLGAGVPAPPPAWLEKPGIDRWLAFGSYCGQLDSGISACATEAQAAARRDIPVVRVVRGTHLRFHLAFVPRHVTLTVGRAEFGATPGKVLGWRARGRGGLLRLSVDRPEGFVTYLVRVSVRPAGPQTSAAPASTANHDAGRQG